MQKLIRQIINYNFRDVPELCESSLGTFAIKLTEKYKRMIRSSLNDSTLTRMCDSTDDFYVFKHLATFIMLWHGDLTRLVNVTTRRLPLCVKDLVTTTYTFEVPDYDYIDSPEYISLDSMTVLEA